MRLIWHAFLAWSVAIVFGPSAMAHEGPDPLCHWYFSPSTFDGNVVKARLGPNAQVAGAPRLVEDKLGMALRFDGVQDYLLVAANSAAASDFLPRKFFTVSAWVTVETGNPGGAIISTLEKDGEGEKGWLLGYSRGVFRFALSAVGSDDGNGRLAVVEGETTFEPGKYYHVAATYDGAEMRLYVNGRLDGQSRSATGPIYQSRSAPYLIGAMADRDELVVHQGCIRDVAVYDLAATEKWVEEEFEHADELAALAPAAIPDEMQFLVTPYLQFVTQDSITVMWETSRPAQGTVRYGTSEQLPETQRGKPGALIHEVLLPKLEAQTPYYYQVEATDDRGRTIRSPLLSFQTANKEHTPFAFGVLSDTQGNPRVCKILSDMLWMQRPNFVIVPGDLGGYGTQQAAVDRAILSGDESLNLAGDVFPRARQSRAERPPLLRLHGAARAGILLHLSLRQRAILHDRLEQAGRFRE